MKQIKFFGVIFLSLGLLVLVMTGCGDEKGLLDEKEKEENNAQEYVDVKVGDKTVKMKKFVMADSAEVAEDVLAEAKTWSDDAEIHIMSGTFLTTGLDGKRAFYGAEGGKYSEWLVSVFSASKGQARLGSWKDGEVTLAEAYGDSDSVFGTISANAEGLNEIVKNFSSSHVYEALSGKIDESTQYYDMELTSGNSIMSSAEDQTTSWKVEVRSINEIDPETNSGKLIKTYRVDPDTKKVSE